VCVKGKGLMSTYLLLSKHASGIRRTAMGFPGRTGAPHGASSNTYQPQEATVKFTL
jgi:hypothetical protein